MFPAGQPGSCSDQLPHRRAPSSEQLAVQPEVAVLGERDREPDGNHAERLGQCAGVPPGGQAGVPVLQPQDLQTWPGLCRLCE